MSFNFLSAALVVSAIVHLLPVPGVLGSAILLRLYGISFTDPNALILLQHRALLFGLLGSAMLWAAFVPSWRVPVALIGLASAASFVLIAWGVGGYNAAIGRVVIADIAVSLVLAAALCAKWVTPAAT
jgi:hypothetical protein